MPAFGAAHGAGAPLSGPRGWRTPLPLLPAGRLHAVAGEAHSGPAKKPAASHTPIGRNRSAPTATFCIARSKRAQQKSSSQSLPHGLHVWHFMNAIICKTIKTSITNPTKPPEGQLLLHMILVGNNTGESTSNACETEQILHPSSKKNSLISMYGLLRAFCRIRLTCECGTNDRFPKLPLLGMGDPAKEGAVGALLSAARTAGGGPRAGGISRAMMAGLGVPPRRPSRRSIRYWSGISMRARRAKWASTFSAG